MHSSDRALSPTAELIQALVYEATRPLPELLGVQAEVGGDDASATSGSAAGGYAATEKNTVEVTLSALSPTLYVVSVAFVSVSATSSQPETR